MTTKRKFWMAIAILVVVCIVGGGLCLKVYHHEKKQESQIREISSRTEYLEGRLNQVQNYYDFQPEYRDDAYNYLAIGNSLTLITNWGKGICATKPDNDYYGLVNQYLNQKRGDVVSYRYNFAPWETATNRASRLDLLNVLLSDKLDLVTIQLGENAADTTTYEQDLEALITYVQQRAPKAKIVVIGDFWDKKRDAMRREAAANKNVAFADISAIIGDKAYQSKEGTECELSDGTVRKVSKAEETHPGDEGMAYIAEKVIEKLD